MKQFPLTPIFSTSLHNLTGLGKTRQSNASLQAHMEAALRWIEYATEMSGDGGVSKGFDFLRGHWAPSYAETTGYTIPTLLNASQAFQIHKLQDLAYRLGDYELNHVTPEGGIVHWQVGKSVIPIVFDTGQVIFGWLAGYLHGQQERFLQAAVRSADWLCRIQDDSGAWRSNQYLGVSKVIDTRVSWGLLCLYKITQNKAYQNAVIKNTDWAIDHQDVSGWFSHCAFREQDDPYTHTIAYTVEGLLECGLLLDDSRLISAAQKTADALMNIQRADGSLAGTYGAAWGHPSRWSCLTGNCQMARIWFRFHQITGNLAYLRAGEKALHYVADHQDIQTKNKNLFGGIPGSQPLWGEYERFKIPNWPAKFFIDAILQLKEIESGAPVILYPG